MPKKKTKRSPKAKLSKTLAEQIVELIEVAERYFRQPAVEASLGHQVAMRTSMDLDESAWYLKDHVLDPEGEGVTASDLRLISKNLAQFARLLSRPELFAASHELSSPPGDLAALLLEAATKIAR